VVTHSDVPAEQIEAYRKTDYRCGQGPDALVLHIDVRSGALAQLYTSVGHCSGVFITAYSPFGQPGSREANEAAHARLGAELKGLGRPVIEGVGADPTGHWPEERSYFVLGVDLESAKGLGLRYQQNAIVWVGADAVPTLILLR
jgi:hypothetical protein